jgi:nucleotide-binding universal stress UspA family protein
MSTITLHDRVLAPTPARVLIAVHGVELDGWGREARRALATWPARGVRVRVLATVVVPRPSFTSLLPVAARRYAGARAAWREAERERLESLIAGLGLEAPDVVWRETPAGDPVPVIVEHAWAWPADILVVGAGRSLAARLAGVPQRLIRRAPCPVLVLVPAAGVPRHAAPALAVAREGA